MSTRASMTAASAIFFLCTAVTLAGTVYVDDDAPVGGDGLSWQTACAYLQDALTLAAGSAKPAEIRIAQGIYRPDEDTLHPGGSGNREATFELVNGVTLSGGYAGLGYADPDVRNTAAFTTVLSGDLDGNDTGAAGQAENSYHIVTGTGTDATAILDGCVVSGGNADGLGTHSSGAGMFNGAASSPSVINCVFRSNTAGGHGAGVYNDSDCYPTLTGCTFANNTAAGYGGGLCNGYHCGGTVTACVFTQNSAVYGGGMRNTTSNPTLTDCTFSENRAGYAAGLDNAEGSDATLLRCTFEGNAATNNAGGMLNSYSSPLIDRCTFNCNSAQSDGGGIYNYFEGTQPLIRNCIFKGNFAEGDGGALYNRNDTVVTVVNCLFTDNYSPYGKSVACDSHGGGHRYPNVVRLLNCIVWEGGGEIWIGDDSVVWVNYCVIPGVWPGLGNRDSDPGLTPDGHLRGDSICVNNGDPAYRPDPDETDMDGETRQSIDIGPDEFVDSDWDNMPDWWEQTYWGSPTAANPQGDPDGDSVNNRREYELSRHPKQGPRNYYVDPVSGSDDWDGLSASRNGLHGPKRTIQSAVGATLTYEGDTVILAAGTYTGPGNRDIMFRGKLITVRSANPDDPAVVAATVIDCQGSVDDPHRGFDFHYAEGPACAVQGLTIINGFAVVGGGGIFCRNTSPLIRANTIAANIADGDGGGIFIRGGAPSVIENTIRANATDDDGGGISCRDASALICGNIITSNASAGDNGGGLFLRGAAPTVTNNIITGNRAEDGGAVWLRDCSAVLANNTIVGNVAGDTGGGVGCRGDFGSALVTITNSILWGNTAANGSSIGLITGAALAISYSDIEGGLSAAYLEQGCNLQWAPGNICQEPCFVEAGYWDQNGTPEIPADDVWINGDYHLKSEGWRWATSGVAGWRRDEVTSRCIDAGNPGMVLGDELTTIPIDPLHQFGQNLRVNMGAYGGTAQASMPPHNWALLADLTNDGAVDLADFAQQARNRAQTGSAQAGDLDRDDLIGTGDLAMLAAQWLSRTAWRQP